MSGFGAVFTDVDTPNQTSIQYFDFNGTSLGTFFVPAGRKRAGKDRWIGAAEVTEKFGVSPEQVVEVMGLMGDTVDNIPGIKGIGKKTAIVLIQYFHSLENLYARLDETAQCNLRGVARIRKILAAGKDQAFLSRQLATVNANVPIEVTLTDVRSRPPDMKKVRALFSELGFFNLIKLLEFGQPA